MPLKAASDDDVLLQANGPQSPGSNGPLPSPMADGQDVFVFEGKLSAANGSPPGGFASTPGQKGREEHDMVKIGHTSLHNPGGRSSWIGL